MDLATQTRPKPVNLTSLPDLRQQVPDLIPYLYPPDTKVISVEEFKPKRSRNRVIPSSLAELLRLAGTSNASEIGRHGPIVASLAAESGSAALHRYEVLFGRDSLIVCDFLKSYYPILVRTTLKSLAALQGLKFDQASEEEPGKIVHEARDPHDPIAVEITRLSGWGWPYYGTIDATPLFVRLLAEAALSDLDFLTEDYVDRAGKSVNMLMALNRATSWLEEKLNKSDLGLLEYQRLNPQGLEHQVWHDSWDSLSHSDGSLANTNRPIASIYAQCVTYDALLVAADLYAKLHQGEVVAKRLRKHAAHIKAQLVSLFWREDKTGGFFAAGLDRDERGRVRQIDTRTCNAGFVLSSRVFDDTTALAKAYLDQTVKLLFSDDMQNASGIRTLARGEKRFVPGGYHTGSVWLWINDYLAHGLDKHGYKAEAEQLRAKTVAVVRKFQKFPEYARGGDEPEPMLNTRLVKIYQPTITEIGHVSLIEQPPQDFQAWTIAAYYDALHSTK